MNGRPWEIWIDVGGTFTDCIARRPAGELLRHKRLSSGVTKGRCSVFGVGCSAGEDSTSAGGVADAAELPRAIDATLSSAPPGFFRGAAFRLLSLAGAAWAEAVVLDNRGDQLLLVNSTAPLPTHAVDQPYELIQRAPAPVLAIRFLLGLSADDPVPPVKVRLGATWGTNALLTRSGARTALVTTRGFRDLLDIGYQDRPKLFELNITKPAPLASEVIEIDERVAADGAVLTPLDEADARRQLELLRNGDARSLAICLMHSWQFPDHERRVAAIAREIGFEEISVSSDVAPLMKIVPRGDTTVVNAYLNPVLRGYVAEIERLLPGSEVRMMTSAGGLVPASAFQGRDSVLSGPAGGVVGFVRAAEACGFTRTIGLDMGGTSTDVSRFDGQLEREYETQKAGVRIVAAMLAIETIAAGGGSICRFDGAKLVVGPRSAGADPGPACYGRGGPLCVTDVNFWLGRIVAERFPFPLNRAAVEKRLSAIAEEILAATGRRYELDELAQGFVDVAAANMARAVRSISIAKGYDAREYVLEPFGGAAGQHACAVAEQLGIRRILCHPDAGLLSALGMGLAEQSRHRSRGVYRPLDASALGELDTVWRQMTEEARGELARDAGADPAPVTVRRSLDVRYQSVEAALSIAEPHDGDYVAAFTAAHRRRFGHVFDNRPLEIVAARVEAVLPSEVVLPQSAAAEPVALRDAPGSKMYCREVPSGRRDLPESGWALARVVDREELRAGHQFDGPAIVHERGSTTIVDPGWQASVLSHGELLLTDLRAAAAPTAIHADAISQPDPVDLEIFNNHFAGIAEQMGIVLRATAGSVNVKERLDFSCAIFTARGELVVNAPHIPVHLGAMGETVLRLIADQPAMRPGDVFVTNDPYRGGSHLPDITVITPVFQQPSGRLLFFTASRAHHAEIGGIVPGSMPPDSHNLAEEGVLIRSFTLIDGGQPRYDDFRTLLLGGKYPTRNVADNLADVAAQVAANEQGAARLLELIAERSWPVVEAYMGHIQAAAEQKLRRALEKLPAGRRAFADHLDCGAVIQVAIDIAADRSAQAAITFDFTGTSGVLPSNLNANRAIVTAAVLYVLRLVVDEDIPLNEGLLRPARIVLPECLLNPPERPTPEECAAMAAGNVETSQRVVDVLLGAMGLAAASQGTMNNLLFGDGTFGYYETICGGAGATAAADGASAVHTHMTNTRLTDPELIERRYPVRVREFSIRRGSGGDGVHRGGDGVARTLEFLRPLEVSLLTERRGPYPPYGAAGGRSGALGRNTLVKADGARIELPAKTHFTAEPGDQLTIETPGGGGFGE